MSFFDGKVSRLYVAEYDLSGYLTEVSGLPGPRNLNEVTTMGEDGAKFIPSLQSSEINLSGFFSDDASGIDVALSTFRSASSGEPIIHLPGGDALGRPGYATEAALIRDLQIRSRVGSVVEQTAPFAANGIVERVTSLGAKATQSSSVNGSSVDDGASSSSGGAWYYWVFAVSASGGNARWQLALQDSADDAAWANVDTVNIDNGVVGAARRTFAGSFDRYVRHNLVLDATSGSITFFAAYIRS